jgi:broad specificity phosphatase PhoE
MTEGLRLYLVRHGEADLASPLLPPVPPEEEGRRALGRIDLPLSRRGEEQARRLAEGLARVPLDRILSSPLLRARRTGEILAEGRGIAPEIRPELSEIHLGEWEGLPFRAIRSAFPELSAARDRDLWGFPHPGGESFADVADRALPLLRELAADPGGARRVLLTAHSGLFRVLLASLLGLPFERAFRLRQDPCGLHLLELRPRGDFEILCLNRTVSFPGDF